MATKESIRYISCFARRKLNLGMDLSRVRSFSSFVEPLETIALLCSSKFKMLRVLDLKNAAGFEVSQQDIKHVGLLLHLKYLHVPEGSTIYALGSLGNLHGLQTLDIRKSNFANIPTAITKLQDLRSLRCSRTEITYFQIDSPGEWLSDALSLIKSNYAVADLHMGFSSCWSDSSGIKMPKGIGSLKQLQILEEVDLKRTSKKAIEELGELTQLRKLVVTGEGVSKEKCKTFCEAVENLSSLRSLSVRYLEVSFIASPLPSLERLSLKGEFQEIPAWVGKCVNLVKIELKYSGLKEVETMAKLPNLLQLSLYSAYNAEKLVFCMHAFPKLKVLNLVRLDIAELAFEDSTSPNMERISIGGCKLTSGINGIKHLPNLKEISVFSSDIAKAYTLREEVDTHPNHPVLQMLNVCEH